MLFYADKYEHKQEKCLYSFLPKSIFALVMAKKYNAQTSLSHIFNLGKVFNGYLNLKENCCFININTGILGI